MVDKQQVMAALSKVRGPDLDGDLVSLGLVSDVVISGDNVMFAITVEASRASELEPLRQAAEKAVGKVDGVEKVMAALTAEVKPGARRCSRPDAAANRCHHGAATTHAEAGPQGPGGADNGRCARRQAHHRGCIRQRRGGQVHHCGQSGRWACRQMA